MIQQSVNRTLSAMAGAKKDFLGAEKRAEKKTIMSEVELEIGRQRIEIQKQKVSIERAKARREAARTQRERLRLEIERLKLGGGENND